MSSAEAATPLAHQPASQLRGAAAANGIGKGKTGKRPAELARPEKDNGQEAKA